MKSVRIASTVKQIEEGDDRVTLFRIQESCLSTVQC
jgi:hypothetical protein